MGWFLRYIVGPVLLFLALVVAIIVCGCCLWKQCTMRQSATLNAKAQVRENAKLEADYYNV